ncbi:DNA-binding NarL/FixJ family response regulator [Kitasatospora sp. MAP12-15]|uniref:response regulator transcription factor n=1 Tax=unclassified Kitasatospora TaxID=2633591 RepID=UPI0024747C9F|nr:response regulator transcription factor [Kitasatospora sp. MAP12-44]MDH6109453.1 DNA-binding NarL/FixJ family response regulator [Kitasatospora sp. MAP12-44]
MSDVSQIAIIEHQNLARYGMEQVLSQHPALRVAATVCEVREFALPAGRLDAIVFGPAPHADDTAESIRTLAALSNVLVISDFAGPHRLVTAIRAGALGCVTKQVGDQEFALAVRTVALGGFHVSPALAPRLHSELNDLGPSEHRVLAPRELETVRWLADGLTHGQIARRMGLTEATVSTYVKRIRSKLNVGNKADLTRTAIELGLLEGDFEPSTPGRSPAGRVLAAAR